VDPVGIGRIEIKRNRTDFESDHENETLTQTLEGEKKLKEKNEFCFGSNPQCLTLTLEE
jgi:hypothetical protein